MTDDTLTDAGARAIREYWFKYLDTLEPLRKPLYSYCLRLTGNVWDAEDLVQDTLLKGYGMTARGDLHGENSLVRNLKAYLFRTATNLWLDRQRKTSREEPGTGEPESRDVDPDATDDAVSKVIGVASPREFAAILLKDVYEFTLDEIADFIGTTPGTVKSALSRARRKMIEHTETPVINDNEKALVRAFVDAINSRDVDQVFDLMSETIQIDVCNVGGGRGRDGEWGKKSLPDVRAEYHEYAGEPIVVMFRDTAVWDILRLEGNAGKVTRLVDYCYAQDTLQLVSESLGFEYTMRGYHQPPETIKNMVASTTLPWRND